MEQAVTSPNPMAPTEDGWPRAASQAILELAAAKMAFTSDDVRGLLASRGITPPTRTALGKAMQVASDSGVIKPNGNRVKSVVKQNRGRKITVLESLQAAA